MNRQKLKDIADSLGVTLSETSDDSDVSHSSEASVTPQSDGSTIDKTSSGSDPFRNHNDGTTKPHIFKNKYYRYWVKTLVETDMYTGETIVKWSQVIPAKDSDFKREWKKPKTKKKPKKIKLDEAIDTKEEVL